MQVSNIWTVRPSEVIYEKTSKTIWEFETFLAIQIRDSKRSFVKKLRLQDTQPLKKETARPMKFNTNFETLMAFERPFTTPPLGNCIHVR